MSLVLLGDFNPSIIQPFWLAEKKLIREGEANEAQDIFIQNGISRFKLDWIEFDVRFKRFEIKVTKEPYFEPARDLFVGILKLLRETPIDALGINYLRNFSLQSEEKLYDFGNQLAPLSLWDNFIDKPRLNDFEILERPRKDGLPGMYRIRLFPTKAPLNIQYGVTMTLNDHFSTEGHQGSDKAGKVVEIISEHWEKSNQRADDITISLLTKLGY